MTARARTTVGYLALLTTIAAANPAGDVYLITDNLWSHTSRPVQEWLAAPPACIRC